MVGAFLGLLRFPQLGQQLVVAGLSREFVDVGFSGKVRTEEMMPVYKALSSARMPPATPVPTCSFSAAKGTRP